MPRILVRLLLSLLVALGTASSAIAAPAKAFVREFEVTGAPAEMKRTLQELLASRISGDEVSAVGSPSEADFLVLGSYVAIGKSFSIDAVIKNSAGKVVAREYEQGDRDEAVLPALTALAKKVSQRLGGKPETAPKAEVEKPARIAKEAEIVKAPPKEQGRDVLGKIPGEMNGIATGKTLQNGDREIFVSSLHGVRFYRGTKQFNLMDEVQLPSMMRVLAVDAADLDGDGVTEIYLSCMEGENVASRIFVVKDDKLAAVQENLPYLMRVLRLNGGPVKLYGQKVGLEGDFYGDIFELQKTGSTYKEGPSQKLPRFGYLYNFNSFTAEGKQYTVILHGSGYLIVYDESGTEMWRSSDSYGGSETYFKKEDIGALRTSGEPARWIFLDQRLVVTPQGEVLVPKNTGFFVIGNNRSYSKNEIYAFAWNGTSLDERWHTKLRQHYLADYAYDQEQKELVVLEVVKKSGIFEKGLSAVTIRKVE